MHRFFFFLILVSLQLHAAIFQTNRMEDVLKYVDEDSWVLFDLDDTLIEGENQLGRAKWYYHEVQKLMAKGHSSHEAQKIFYPEWILSQILCPARTPEPRAAEIVSKIQSIAAKTFGLTARHPPISSVTLEQLQRLGIDFSCSAPLLPDIDMQQFHPTLYKSGVWFLSDFNSKSACFVRFLEETEHPPKTIVFVDDGRHHLEDMQTLLAAKDVAFIGIHYTKAIERPFNAAIADLQYKALPEILSDKDAAARLF